MAKTKIEWCDHTVCPIVGCSKISTGCRNCYAEKMAYRLKKIGIKKYQDVVDKNGWTGKIGVDMSVFKKLPKKPSKVFVCSMGDLFHPNVSLNMIDFVISQTMNYPQHTFMLLTKRPKIMRYWYERAMYFDKNIWIGVTAENQEMADKRIPELLKITAAVRFVSIEPMLEKIELDRKYIKRWNAQVSAWEMSWMLQDLSWVIAGPETGPHARKCNPEWIRDLHEQCRAANIPFFDKSKKNWIERKFPK